jgi:hypothetical protein
MRKIRMLHCNPQGCFSHGAPPTDELKSEAPITVGLRTPLYALSGRGQPTAAPAQLIDTLLS